ncbi:hypothetical protein BON30_36260 [Cystobacter ferrugineus]|uniref:Lipoprotein n=1 Tax=Cystobacter ferrugineus TaxID=83449 RepID=A0A1L9B1I7_9BACT|nr:hypothetical protein BON30_36260 [Cystobacter ferrugineus]
MLLLGGLFALCGPVGYAADSVSNACRQNPAYCALLHGQEAGAAPTVRSGAEIASIAATLRFLSPELTTRIEQVLRECAEWADTEIDRQHFGGRPSRAQCREEVTGLDPCGRKTNRAMQLGTEKHQLALQCTQEKLGALIPGRFSLEQRYRYDKQTGQKQWLSPEEVRALRQRGCGDELKGTLVPDVVIHPGSPLAVVAIYDFKFPCPISNRPQWSEYPEESVHRGRNQGELYRDALGVEPNLVAPTWGIIRWLASP